MRRRNASQWPPTSEDFWRRIEERIYAALRDYAEQAENGGGFQRRLFAEDAARGFPFIDVCRKRYDLVVMNPPYGLATSSSDAWVRENYEDTCNDLYGSFSERAFDLTVANRGYVGAITSKTFLYSKRLREFRTRLANDKHRLRFLIDFGLGVLDAMVETAAWVAGPRDSQQTVFWDWTSEDKAALSNRALELLFSPESSPTIASLEQFRVLPFGLFSYWCPPEVLAAVSGLKAFEPQFGESVKGLTTFDDFRFVRLGWECDCASKHAGDWRYIAKGGGWSRYHSETAMLIDWRKNGEIPRQNELKNYATDARSKQSISFWFRRGLTFSEVSSLGFSSQPQQEGNLFGGSGFCIFPKGQFPMAVWLAFFNSRPVFSLMSMFSTDRHWNSEMVARLPVPDLARHSAKLAALGTRQFMLARRDGESSETAAEFTVAPLTAKATGEDELRANQQELDTLVATAYGFSEVSLGILAEKYPIPFHRSETAPDTGIDAKISYYCGCAFGRWDIRYATGEQAVPELPDPFAPLPVCPPGQLQNAQGLPMGKDELGIRNYEADRAASIHNSNPLGKDELRMMNDEAERAASAHNSSLIIHNSRRYPIEIPWDGILVDDPNHPLDLERRVREVIEIIWGAKGKSTPHPGPLPGRRGDGGATAEAIEHEAWEILGVKSLRDYFRKPGGFFADHLKRYSKSRRQAPIYWPLSTAFGSYTLWIYYHRLTDQTLFQCVNDFVKPKLEEVNRDLERLNAECRMQNGGTAKQREQVEALGDFTIELKEFHDELLRVAGLPYKPNLNDGVLITASPLWKLFRLPKWQKELKACWEALETDEYEWAHLAYTLWPDRVKKVCKTDRSIAIAHGLEDLCEVKAPEKKMKREKKKTESELDMERTPK